MHIWQLLRKLGTSEGPWQQMPFAITPPHTLLLYLCSMEVCGRVLVRPQPLGSWMYPLYFRMLGRSAEIPGGDHLDADA